MKKMIKYQLKDLLLSYSVYAAAMVLLLAVLVSVSAMYDDINMSINGNGFSSVIFCFVSGIAIYKEHCQLAIQNSISRKDFFRSSIYSLTALSFLCALLDLLLQGAGRVTESVSTVTTNFDLGNFILLFYPKFLEKSSDATVMAAGFFLSFFVCMVFAMLGLLIAGIYCRIPKKYRTFYCVLVPVIFFGVTPAFTVMVVFSPEATLHIAEFLLNIFASLDIMGTASGNPFRAMFTFGAVSLIMGYICYRILRKTEMV